MPNISTTTCSYSAPAWISDSTLTYDLTLFKDGDSFNFASSTCVTETSSSTAPVFFNGFSYGEIISTTLLFLIFAQLFYQFLHGQLRGIKIKE